MRRVRIATRERATAASCAVNLNDPFGRRTKRPPTFDRFARVTQLGDLAIALLDGVLPAPEARAWLGGAILARLQRGGNLEDYLQIRPPRGSRLTAERLWRESGGAGGDVIADVGRPDEDGRQSDQGNDDVDDT